MKNHDLTLQIHVLPCEVRPFSPSHPRLDRQGNQWTRPTTPIALQRGHEPLFLFRGSKAALSGWTRPRFSYISHGIAETFHAPLEPRGLKNRRERGELQSHGVRRADLETSVSISGDICRS